MKYFAIYDQAAAAFIDPFYIHNSAMAIREFEAACNNPKSKFHQHPADFTLFELGVWDNEKGTHVDHSVGINLGCALTFMKSEPNLEVISNG